MDGQERIMTQVTGGDVYPIERGQIRWAFNKSVLVEVRTGFETNNAPVTRHITWRATHLGSGEEIHVRQEEFDPLNPKPTEMEVIAWIAGFERD